MPEHHEKAVYRAVSNRLFNATGAGVNVYIDHVPEKKTRPYIVLDISADNQRGWFLRTDDPEIVMLVKAVSTEHGEALDIVREAQTLLDDQGEQDLGGVSGGTDWHILKMTVEEGIRQEYMTGTTRIYERGFNLRIAMQER